MTPTMTLLKFESPTCAVCMMMKKKQTVEMVATEYKNQFNVISLVVNDTSGDVPEGTPYSEAYDISEEMEVQALPTLVMVDAYGAELGRLDGAPTISQLRKFIEECAESVQSQTTLIQRVNAYAAKGT